MAQRDTRNQTRQHIADLEASIRRAKALIAQLAKAQSAKPAPRAAASAAKTSTKATPKPAAAKRPDRAQAASTPPSGESNAETTVEPQAVPPQLRTANLSKAPGKKHRTPPVSMKGVKHSRLYIAKAKISRELHRHTRG